jgi:energy-coupling factor transporter ATP-binding protein EcfA2
MLKTWSEIFDGSNFSMLICGSSGSGKTQLLKTIINSCKKNYDYFVILCPSLEFSGDYKEFQNNNEDKKFIFFNEYRADVIKEVMSTQEDIIVRYGKNRCPKVVMILDDCLDNLKYHSLPEVLYFRGRHINISPISLVQKLRGVSTILRANTTSAIFFRSGNEAELEAFVETYCGRRERKFIEQEISNWFKDRPFTFLYCNFRTHNYDERYILGADKKLMEAIELNR